MPELSDLYEWIVQIPNFFWLKFLAFFTAILVAPRVIEQYGQLLSLRHRNRLRIIAHLVEQGRSFELVELRSTTPESVLEALNKVPQSPGWGPRLNTFYRLWEAGDEAGGQIDFSTVGYVSINGEEFALVRRPNRTARYRDSPIAIALVPRDQLDLIKARIGESTMEPITALFITGSIASIISALRDIDPKSIKNISAKDILKRFRALQAEKGTLEWRHGDKVSDQEVLDRAKFLLSLSAIDQDILDRIDGKCITPFKEAIRDHDLDNADVREAFEITKRCVCDLLKLAMEKNGGRFPSQRHKELWIEYGC